jgi:Secretion system C-terminal sorting domain
MRKIFLIYATLFLFYNTVFAQKTPYFSKRIDLGFGYDETQNTLLRVSDGLILFSALEQLLYKLDTVGNLKWKWKVPKGSTTTALDIRNDSIFIVINVVVKNGVLLTTGKGDLYMQFFNTKGDSLNRMELGSDKFEQGVGMLAAKDGGFVFAGTRSSISPYIAVSQDSLVVFKCDLKGKLLWEKRVEAADSSRFYAIFADYLYSLENGSYAFTFVARIKGKENKVTDDNRFTYHVKFNDNGVVEKAKFLLKDKKEGLFWTQPTRSGQFIGSVQDYDPGYINIVPSYLTLFDYDMNIIKKGVKFAPNRDRDNFPVRIKELKQTNTFICVGINEEHDSMEVYISGNSGPVKGVAGGPWIAKVNSNCEMLWERVIIDFRYLERPQTGGLWDFVVMDNGDYICTGDIFRRLLNGATYDLWLVRLDSMGCPYPNCKGKLQAINSKTDNEEVSGQLQGVKIMPNPTTGPLWFEIPDDLLQQDVTVQCFDLSGRNVYQRDFIATQSVFNLDIGDLSNGLYFIRIQDKNGRGCAKKILKQE